MTRSDTASPGADPGPSHRSFHLTRPATAAGPEPVCPGLVLPERDVRAIAAAAAREDVTLGGCFSARPAGLQLWSGPWDGPLGGLGGAQHLGSMDWSYDTPVRQYVTFYRLLVTPQGLRAGETPDSILSRALGLAGLARPDGARSVVSPPRDAARLRPRP